MFLGIDIALDRHVAIKVMSPSMLQSHESVERFRREARVLAALNHPHIVPIYAIGDSPDLAYYVMKYIEGRSLDSIIQREGPQSLAFTQTLLAQVGAALQFAHDRGVVHRDVKPANVMIEDGGWAVLTDFGIARFGDLQGLTSPGTVMGTPQYMSPERFSGVGDGRAADQYSLGVIAHELLTGKLPFGGTTLEEVLRGHLFEEAPRLQDTRGDITEPVDRCVRQMLAKNPENRFATVADAVAAFGTVSADVAPLIRSTMIALARGNAAERPRISAPPSPPLGLQPRIEREGTQSASVDTVPPPRGRRVQLSVVGLAVVTLLGIGVFLRQGGERGNRPIVASKGRAPIASSVIPDTSAPKQKEGARPQPEVHVAEPKAIEPNTNAPAVASATVPAAEKGEGTIRKMGPTSGVLRCVGKPQLGCGLEGDQFVLIAAGTFRMGSPVYRESNEQPVHAVTISRPFYLQKTEVTQGQWRAVMGSNPSDFTACGDQCPVEQVSWDDIQAFLVKLNSMSDGGFRLPTEAEWEFAARAGTTGETYGPIDAVAWYGDRSGQVHAVAGKQPNAWGLYDMLGNVSEWVSDAYGAYQNAPAFDPTGPGSGNYHSLRGGSFLNTSFYVRAAYRFAGGVSSNRYNYVGFRLAWSS